MPIVPFVATPSDLVEFAAALLRLTAVLSLTIDCTAKVFFRLVDLVVAVIARA
jgi:hypothetical protein